MFDWLSLAKQIIPDHRGIQNLTFYGKKYKKESNRLSTDTPECIVFIEDDLCQIEQKNWHQTNTMIIIYQWLRLFVGIGQY